MLERKDMALVCVNDIFKMVNWKCLMLMLLIWLAPVDVGISERQVFKFGDGFETIES